MRRRLGNMRLSLRTRLTLIYGTLFLAMGGVLVAVTYTLTVNAVNTRFGKVAIIRGESVAPPPGEMAEPAPQMDRLYMAAAERDVNQLINERRHEVVNQLVQSSVLTLLAVGILAVLLGYFVAGRTLRPLQTVTATARRLSESNLHERIGLTGPRDEIKDLADTFDAMLARLHRAFESQRRFIANASHELRTPLAINRAVIEVALAKPDAPDTTRALAGKLLGNTARHERLIEGLLLLARSERGLRERTQVDVAELATTAIDQLTEAAEQAEVTIKPMLGPGRTAGDVVLLERCVVNLVENAIKYNVADGHVRVVTSEHDGQVYIQVENTGPEVPRAQLQNIFEPFRRLRQDRVGSAGGAGLGLSIVRAVIHAHGGGIRTYARPGGGLVITLRLPAVTTTPTPALTQPTWNTHHPPQNRPQPALAAPTSPDHP